MNENREINYTYFISLVFSTLRPFLNETSQYNSVSLCLSFIIGVLLDSKISSISHNFSLARSNAPTDFIIRF